MRRPTTTNSTEKRKTLRRFHEPSGLYFVTTSNRRRRLVFAGESGGVVAAAFERLRAEDRADVLAYVVMPDHVHAIVRSRGEATVGKVMAFLKRVVGNELRRRGVEGWVWEARFYDRLIRDEDEFWNAVRYIHENPVKAGICERPEEWAWSTSNAAVGADLEDLLVEWSFGTGPSDGWSSEQSEPGADGQ